MGAAFVTETERGKTLSDAFRKAKEQAEEEYGRDAYNGQFNNFDGLLKDVTREFKSSGRTLNQYISEIEGKSEKGDCYAICLEEPVTSSAKIKSKVNHVIEKGTKKWVLKYCVYDFDRCISTHATKGEAVKAARQYTEKHQTRTRIVMEKHLEKGNNVVATVEYKYDSREKLGKWVFFGNVRY